jgi:hypothetical protein
MLRLIYLRFLRFIREEDAKLELEAKQIAAREEEILANTGR